MLTVVLWVSVGAQDISLLLVLVRGWVTVLGDWRRGSGQAPGMGWRGGVSTRGLASLLVRVGGTPTAANENQPQTSYQSEELMEEVDLVSAAVLGFQMTLA